MTRWSKFRVVSEITGEIPETAYEARVFLDNAWRHLMVQFPTTSIDARMIIHNIGVNYEYL